MIRTLSLCLTRWLTGAKAHYAGAKPAAARRIYAVNHSSHLDTVLTLAALPHAEQALTRPVAISSYWNGGAMRRYFAQRVFRAVLIERGTGDLNPLAPAFAALRDGKSLIFYPEGTRGPGQSLQPLRPGIFHLARAFRDVDVVPVWIDNAHRILPKGRWVPLPMPCSVTFGAPVRWRPQEDSTAFLDRLRVAMEITQRDSARESTRLRPAIASQR